MKWRVQPKPERCWRRKWEAFKPALTQYSLGAEQLNHGTDFSHNELVYILAVLGLAEREFGAMKKESGRANGETVFNQGD